MGERRESAQREAPEGERGEGKHQQRHAGIVAQGAEGGEDASGGNDEGEQGFHEVKYRS